jgi:ribonuclease BN (tRNA processing enzyme)
MSRAPGLAAILAALFLASAMPASGAPVSAALTFTTLGTNAGPIPRADRAEPANLVRYGDQVVLVDVGDGAAGQLAKAGVPLGRVQAVLISHLHFDHTGGLFALLSLRFQSRQNTPLAIYGPPGTKDLVQQLFLAMGSGAGAVRSMGPSVYGPPETGVSVVEIQDGSAFALGAIRITARENSHYQTLGPPSADRPLSLSYRFDAPGRAIVYTGDTGVSDAVAQLCRGADVLVSEIMDPALALAQIRKTNPDFPPAAAKALEGHFRLEHLAPADVGRLAAACGVRTLVATHNSLERDELAGARRQIGASYKGEIRFADDLQTF